RRDPAQRKIRRQDERQWLESLVQQPGCLPPGRLPQTIAAGSLDLREVLLALEMQIRQLPEAAAMLGRGVCNGAGKDSDVVAEVDPRDPVTVWRGHDHGSDDPAASFAA